MIRRLHAWLSTARTPHVLALLFAAFICVTLFVNRRQALAPHSIPDGRLWYGPAELAAMLGAFTDPQRALYARSEVTVDLLFPLCYGVLLGIWLARFYKDPPNQWHAIVPIVGALADLGENAINAYLAWNFPDGPWALAYGSGTFSSVKWLAAVFSIAAGTLRSIQALKRRLSRTHPPGRADAGRPGSSPR